MIYSYAPGSAAAHTRAVAELARGAAPAEAAHVILRAAQPYDLATPGTPLGITAVARAADEGGVWRYIATFALAMPAGGEPDAVVASLALRLAGDEGGRARRAAVVYVRRTAADGRSRWEPHGSAVLLDSADAERPVRPVGVEELKAILRGRPWAPPPPRLTYTVPCPTCRQPARLTSAGQIYASHRCDTKHVEGRS